MARCILTSMRDLYSVTFHFPLAPVGAPDLGHVYLHKLIFSIALGSSDGRSSSEGRSILISLVHLKPFCLKSNISVTNKNIGGQEI